MLFYTCTFVCMSTSDAVQRCAPACMHVHWVCMAWPAHLRDSNLHAPHIILQGSHCGLQGQQAADVGMVDVQSDVRLHALAHELDAAGTVLQVRHALEQQHLENAELERDIVWLLLCSLQRVQHSQAYSLTVHWFPAHRGPRCAECPQTIDRTRACHVPLHQRVVASEAPAPVRAVVMQVLPWLRLPLAVPLSPLMHAYVRNCISTERSLHAVNGRVDRAPALEENEAITLHNGSEEFRTDKDLVITDCNARRSTEVVLWPLKQRHVSHRYPKLPARLLVQRCTAPALENRYLLPQNIVASSPLFFVGAQRCN